MARRLTVAGVLAAVAAAIVALVVANVIAVGITKSPSHHARAVIECASYAESGGTSSVSFTWSRFHPAWECDWSNPDDSGGATVVDGNG